MKTVPLAMLLTIVITMSATAPVMAQGQTQKRNQQLGWRLSHKAEDKARCDVGRTYRTITEALKEKLHE